MNSGDSRTEPNVELALETGTRRPSHSINLSSRKQTDCGNKLVEITPEQALHLPEIPFDASQRPISCMADLPSIRLPPSWSPRRVPSRLPSHPSLFLSQALASVDPRADSLDGPSHPTGGLPPAVKLRGGGETSFTEPGKDGGLVLFPFIIECFPFLGHSKQHRSCLAAHPLLLQSRPPHLTDRRHRTEKSQDIIATGVMLVPEEGNHLAGHQAVRVRQVSMVC